MGGYSSVGRSWVPSSAVHGGDCLQSKHSGRGEKESLEFKAIFGYIELEANLGYESPFHYRDWKKDSREASGDITQMMSHDTTRMCVHQILSAVWDGPRGMAGTSTCL